jgi:hypothetical protein
MEFFQLLILIALASFFVTNTGMETMVDLVSWISDKADYEPKNKMTEWLGVIFIGFPLMILGFVLTVGLQLASVLFLLIVIGDFIVMPIWEHAKDAFGWY